MPGSRRRSGRLPPDSTDSPDSRDSPDSPHSPASPSIRTRTPRRPPRAPRHPARDAARGVRYGEGRSTRDRARGPLAGSDEALVHVAAGVDGVVAELLLEAQELVVLRDALAARRG